MVAVTLAAVVLVALTVFALTGNGSTPVAGKPTGSSAGSSPGAGGSSAATSPTSSDSPSNSTAATSAATSPVSPASAAGCMGAQLTIAAAAGAPSYAVGASPVLMLQVTNNGPANCIQDLADSQVELRVFNGAARVWGSHDCEVQPGTDVKTLAVGSTVGIQIVWSGLSSQPGCAGTRQRVGAGAYTLYALLSGTQGAPAQFTIT
jgi:hypothetical protein